MTKEIAQYCMKAYSQYHNEMCEECPIYGQTGDDHCFEDALQYVINHFDVLDKIIAENEQAKIYILKTEDGKEIKASANDVINPDNRNYTSGLKRNEANSCDRKCKKCDLVLPTDEILDAYKEAIVALEYLINRKNNG